MDVAEAEAIYDSGRERCVEFILELAGLVERLTAGGELLEERVRRLEEQARRDSRTSSMPPSQDPPKTRQQRRAEARARAKELLSRDAAKRKPGGQEGHRGAGRGLAPEDQVDEIVAHYPLACGGCGREFGEDERRLGGRFGRHQVAELPPDQRAAGRASHSPAALPGLPCGDDSRLAGRGRRLSVRAAVAGGGRDVDRTSPDLAPRRQRAGVGSVRDRALDRQRGRGCQFFRVS